MADNKIVIGDGKGKDKKETGFIKEETIVNTMESAPSIEQESVQESVQEPLDENVWGNDHSLLNKLDEEQLADRRLYTRAIYMQRIECNTIYKSIEAGPTLLTKPIVFMVIDISLGGIGIICEHEISTGTILAFKLAFDNIAYEIKCEVVYCFPNNDKFRAGLKMAEKDKYFIRHLKIFVARLSLQSKYAAKSTDLTPL